MNCSLENKVNAMSSASAVRLVILAAIWGASFLFMRIAVPAFGPVLLIALRVLLAAMLLAAIALLSSRRLDLRRQSRTYLMMGLLNAALPFVLIAFAARTLNASLLSILNATSPIFGAIVAAVWLRQKPSCKTMFGLLLGFAGVALLVGRDAAMHAEGSALAVIAALAGALCYGVASTWLKQRVQEEDPFDTAHGSMWAASLILLPLAVVFPASGVPSTEALTSLVLLGLLCTGIAFILYYRLVRDVGPMRALTVTFLIPVFGVLFGWLVLDEPVGWHTFAGAVVVLAGTALSTGFSPRLLHSRSAESAS